MLQKRKGGCDLDDDDDERNKQNNHTTISKKKPLQKLQKAFQENLITLRGRSISKDSLNIRGKNQVSNFKILRKLE